MSLRARLLSGWLRRVEKPAIARAASPAVVRRRFEFYGKFLFHAPRGTQFQWQTFEQGQRRVEVLDVVPRSLTNDVTLFYIHGGGFVFGSPKAYGGLAGMLAKALGARVVLPRYRRAPEAVFPTALDDVRAAWDGLCASGTPPGRIVIGGDSAGGALALSLLADLLREGATMPAGVFCFSPLTDLSFSGDSFRKNADREAVLPVNQAGGMVGMYLNGHPPDDPRVSPLWGSYEGAPPVWITVGDTEILHDDARRMAVRLRDEGVQVTLEEKHDLPHVWPLFHNTLPEAHETIRDLAQWINGLRNSGGS